MNKLDLKERSAIITGAAQGIGLAITERVLQSGGRVALWDRNQEQLSRVLGELDAGDRTVGIHADIGDLSSVEEATKEVIDAFGTIDILVNNAALIGPNVPLWEYPTADFEEILHVDVTGTFYVCRTVVPHMISAGYGRIVNIASIAGKEGNPNACAYSSAKAAVVALTKVLGKELAEFDIAVNCVTPAFAKTKGSMAQSPEFIEYVVSKIPRGRMMELEEAASMVGWLCSQENSFTTGAVFDLSGGRATY